MFPVGHLLCILAYAQVIRSRSRLISLLSIWIFSPVSGKSALLGWFCTGRCAIGLNIDATAELKIKFFGSTQDRSPLSWLTLVVILCVQVVRKIIYLYRFPNYSSCPVFDVDHDFWKFRNWWCKKLLSHVAPVMIFVLLIIVRFDGPIISHLFFCWLTSVRVVAVSARDFMNSMVFLVDLHFNVGWKVFDLLVDSEQFGKRWG